MPNMLKTIDKNPKEYFENLLYAVDCYKNGIYGKAVYYLNQASEIKGDSQSKYDFGIMISDSEDFAKGCCIFSLISSACENCIDSGCCKCCCGTACAVFCGATCFSCCGCDADPSMWLCNIGTCIGDCCCGCEGRSCFSSWN